MIKKILENGGATLNPNTLEDAGLKEGYMVALNELEEVIPVESFNASQLERMASIARAKGGYLGAWVNDNKVYLDISYNVLTRHDAIIIGEREKQLAIWDVKNMREIVL